jgi:NADH:flavin oxidoreductase / NADH oxidase family
MAPTSVVEAVRPQQAVAELLFQPYRLGPFTLPHRIVMAPLTRSRARQPGNVPTSLNRLLLRTTGFSRVHYQRSNPGLDARAGLCLDTRYPQP